MSLAWLLYLITSFIKEISLSVLALNWARRVGAQSAYVLHVHLAFWKIWSEYPVWSETQPKREDWKEKNINLLSLSLKSELEPSLKKKINNPHKPHWNLPNPKYPQSTLHVKLLLPSQSPLSITVISLYLNVPSVFFGFFITNHQRLNTCLLKKGIYRTRKSPCSYFLPSRRRMDLTLP